jgi:hypothetical protein
MNGVNKKPAVMFHMGKGKKTKGKGFKAMPNDVAEEDMAVRLALNAHSTFMARLWKNTKHISGSWTNCGPMKRAPCYEVLYNLRNIIPKD